MEGRKDGRTEGRKDGRTEGRKDGTMGRCRQETSRCVLHALGGGNVARTMLLCKRARRKSDHTQQMKTRDLVLCFFLPFYILNDDGVSPTTDLEASTIVEVKCRAVTRPDETYSFPQCSC